MGDARTDINSVQVAVRIQAHPSRAHLWPNLIESLAPLPVEVSVHSSEPPSPWLGYKQALSDLPDCTHLLLLQEDVLICRNLPLAVEKIAEAKPDNPVCLFLSWLPNHIVKDARQALLHGQRYIVARPAKFCPVVAVLWPVTAVERFLSWAEAAKLPGHPGHVRSDDAVLAEWIRRMHETVWIALPSLVEHPDTVPSVKGRNNAAWGRDKGRRALQWVGPERDPLELDWS
jgi:hypothetical protein